MAPAPLFRVSVTPSATHNQIGPLWCSFLSGWVCVRSRILWVSPRNSPVRLGVSPAAASTPTGVFNQRFEDLYPHAGALGYAVCLAPQLFLPVYPHTNVGLLCLPPCQTYPPGTSLPQVLSILAACLHPSNRSG